MAASVPTSAEPWLWAVCYGGIRTPEGTWSGAMESLEQGKQQWHGVVLQDPHTPRHLSSITRAASLPGQHPPMQFPSPPASSSDRNSCNCSAQSKTISLEPKDLTQHIPRTDPSTGTHGSATAWHLQAGKAGRAAELPCSI